MQPFCCGPVTVTITMAKLGIRKILERAVTAIVVVLLGGAVSRADVAAYDMPSIVARVMPTVVNISVRKLEQPSQAPSVAVTADASVPLEPDSPLIKHYVASGFVIDPAGVIVTNYHAVENAFEIAVTLEDGSTRPGSLVHQAPIMERRSGGRATSWSVPGGRYARYFSGPTFSDAGSSLRSMFVSRPALESR